MRIHITTKPAGHENLTKKHVQIVPNLYKRRGRWSLDKIRAATYVHIFENQTCAEITLQGRIT